MSIYGINLGKNKEQIELARLINENNKQKKGNYYERYSFNHHNVS